MRITTSILSVIILLTVPISVISLRPHPHFPNSPCQTLFPKTLRSDQITVLINGYSEHRIPLLRSIAAAYSSASPVSAVVILWCNPKTPDETLSSLSRNLSAAVLRPPSASLNHRFHPWELIKTRAVLICDDDVLPDPKSVTFAFKVWRSDPYRIVGFFARSHAYDIGSKSWIYTMEMEKYSIVLTKLMILHVDYLVKYSCGDEYAAARAIVSEMNNCEDILINFVISDTIGKGPILVGSKEGGGIRDFGDGRNDHGVFGVVKEVGLSSRKGEHRKRRGECIGAFHRVLGKMPLRYSYGKVVDEVEEQGLCEKGGKVVKCDEQEEDRRSNEGEEDS